MVLKGSDVAFRFYPQKHWRVMADVDLLIEEQQVPAAKQILLELGFRNPSSQPDADWDDHHHIVPLFNKAWGVWVEIHHGLFADDYCLANHPLFDPKRCLSEASNTQLFDADCKVLGPQTTLAYVAAHWYRNLIGGTTGRGAQRGVLDGMFVLQKVPLDISDLCATNDALGRVLVYFLDTLSRSGLCQEQIEQAVKRPPGYRLIWALIRWHVLDMKSSSLIYTGNLAAMAFEESLVAKNSFQFYWNVMIGTVTVTLKAMAVHVKSLRNKLKFRRSVEN